MPTTSFQTRTSLRLHISRIITRMVFECNVPLITLWMQFNHAFCLVLFVSLSYILVLLAFNLQVESSLITLLHI
jgi:hypothetical protein